MNAATHITSGEVRPTRIVVGVNGSERSIEALRYGLRLANSLHTRLDAVIAWQFPVTFGINVDLGFSPEETARHALAGMVARVLGDAPPPWFRSVVQEGSAARILIEESAGAEMLIVGGHAKGAFAGTALGAVAAACASHAHCPVLVLHADDRHVGDRPQRDRFGEYRGT